MTVALLAGIVAVANGLGWAGLDAARKKLVVEAHPAGAAAWVNLAQGPIFIVWAIVTGAEVAPAYWPFGLGTLTLQVAANLLFFAAIRSSPLSTTIPFLSFTPVFATLFGLLLLRQYPSIGQLIGIGLVVAGALTIHEREGRSLVQILREERGSMWMVGVAAIWSLTTALDRLVLEHASLPVHGATQSGGVGLAIVVALLLRGQRDALRVPAAAWNSLGACVALATVALAFQLWAIQLLLVGLVEATKRAIGFGSAVLLGRWMFGEALSVRKGIAVLLLAGGTVLLLMPK
ncbi:MAG: DMT family transporter [Myxococcota bacterium]